MIDGCERNVAEKWCSFGKEKPEILTLLKNKIDYWSNHVYTNLPAKSTFLTDDALNDNQMRIRLIKGRL